MIYFVSDFHLGIDTALSSLERERLFVQFLEEIKADAEHIYILGDLFDFWYEYKTVVPKGFVRVMGKLAELSDSGVQLSFFTGNHDQWMRGYFEKELGIKVYYQPLQISIGESSFYLGHGDGLGPGDKGYKFIKLIFESRICRFLFGLIHPSIAIKLANGWSKNSRDGHTDDFTYHGKDKEWLFAYCNDQLDEMDIDYFIFGHRHLAIDLELKNGKSRYINTGEWMYSRSYVTFDGKMLKHHFYKNPDGKVYSD